MKLFKKINILLSLALTCAVSSVLVGCGGEDESATQTIEPIDVGEPATASQAPTKKRSSTKRVAKSVEDRIDDALDRGNYMGAVDIAIKSGKTASENMSYLTYVQTELGGPMARGDKKAHEAYKKLNYAFIQNHQR